MSPSMAAVVVGAFVLCLALVLAHNAVLAWLGARAEAERRREEHYHALVEVALRALNTAREELAAAWKRNEKHLETVLEDFLSRDFTDRQMGRMLDREIMVDQEGDAQPLDIGEDDELAAERERAAAGAGRSGNGEVTARLVEVEERARRLAEQAKAGFEATGAGPEGD